MVELLVAIGVSGVAFVSMLTFYAGQMKNMRQHLYRVETQQALRGSLDAVTRDIRLAGACLPVNGQFVALQGVDSANGDSITVRTGMVRNNLSCIQSTVTADVNAGVTALPVQSASGFTAGVLAYVRHPNGSGELSPVTAVAGNTVTIQNGLSQAYPVPSGVFAVDERIYALDKTNPAIPKLTLTIDRGAAEAFAAGISNLQFSYILDQNCPACTVSNLPPDTATWRLVNEVRVTVTAQTVGGVLPSDAVTLVASSNAKPRNLLP
jgi:Tfp pilus assembly protein PilW